MAESNNTYEEARKKRLLENNSRLQDLGIPNIRKSLSELTNSEKKSQPGQPRLSKPRSKSVSIVEPRRSSRARNPVVSYADNVEVDRPPLRKRSRSNSSSWASYVARPLDEIRTASYEERAQAFKAAEELQSNLESGFPSFVKSMVRSHVYSCFWLGLPTKFCEDHLPKLVVDMVLEDENGKEYDAIFIGKRTGLSGGWRGFALDHKLDDGDALVFELVEPARFKIYIIRASPLAGQEHNANVTGKDGFTADIKKATKVVMELDLQPKESDMLSPSKSGCEGTKDVKRSASEKLKKKAKQANGGKLKKEISVEEKKKVASFKLRKKPAPKLFRKKGN